MDDRHPTRHPSRRGAAATLATVALLLVLCPPALAQQLSGSLGLDLLQGDCGTEETTTAFAVTGTLVLSRDWWAASLQLPAHRVDGPGTPFAGGCSLPPRPQSGGSGGDPGELLAVEDMRLVQVLTEDGNTLVLEGSFTGVNDLGLEGTARGSHGSGHGGNGSGGN